MEMGIINGSAAPLGFSIINQRANFSLYCKNAVRVYLGLFRDGKLVDDFLMNQSMDTWHLGIKNLPSHLEYAYCIERKGKRTDWIIDPYAKKLGAHFAKAELPDPFDWGQDRPPRIPLDDLIIYEMHVRGFTKSPTSKIEHGGTFLGVIEKIDYLKSLGINAVELMPIFAFHKTFHSGKLDYWGYNPNFYFAPSKQFGVKDAALEFKKMVKALHENGIEVILDVVYNHTGVLCPLRHIDRQSYYMIGQNHHDLNFSGCGNTLNTNGKAAMQLIRDSMRYWVQEMHVDGFRFDLASIFTRDGKGAVLEEPPILKKMKKDPILSSTKFIAEPWDAGGLYQLGYFQNHGRFSEWNGFYRDTVRRFLKGGDGIVGDFAEALMGSSRIYKKATSSVNFITAHDGFCLKDLVSYQQKHNEANGEENRDGCDHNDSWNSGHEGKTSNPQIIALRGRQMRNFLLALFLSKGIPMLLMGDEIGHTRNGNNNPYIHDNELNWQDYAKMDKRIFSFVKKLIHFRKTHPFYRKNQPILEHEVHWHNRWDSKERFLACTIKKVEPHIHLVFNASHKERVHELPPGQWRPLVLTQEDWVMEEKKQDIHKVKLSSYSALLALKR